MTHETVNLKRKLKQSKMAVCSSSSPYKSSQAPHNIYRVRCMLANVEAQNTQCSPPVLHLWRQTLTTKICPLGDWTVLMHKKSTLENVCPLRLHIFPTQDFLVLHLIICSGLQFKVCLISFIRLQSSSSKDESCHHSPKDWTYFTCLSTVQTPQAYTISMQDLLPEGNVEAWSINRFKVGLDKSMQDKGPSADDH